jgi:hypothetical protein
MPEIDFFRIGKNRVKKTYMGLEGHVDNQGDPTERCQNTSNSGWFARNVAA